MQAKDDSHNTPNWPLQWEEETIDTHTNPWLLRYSMGAMLLHSEGTWKKNIEKKKKKKKIAQNQISRQTLGTQSYVVSY